MVSHNEGKDLTTGSTCHCHQCASLPSRKLETRPAAANSQCHGILSFVHPSLAGSCSFFLHPFPNNPSPKTTILRSLLEVAYQSLHSNWKTLRSRWNTFEVKGNSFVQPRWHRWRHAIINFVRSPPLWEYDICYIFGIHSHPWNLQNQPSFSATVGSFGVRPTHPLQHEP